MDSLLKLPTCQQSSQLYRPITWVPAAASGRPVHECVDGGLLIPLNAPFQAAPGKDDSMPGPLVHGPGGTLPASPAPGGLKSKRELFREEDVQLGWSTVSRVGSGLQNLGNTCFMNSVLQCLAHTPPFAEAVLSGRAQPPTSSSSSDDPLTITLAHIKRVFSSHGIVRPSGQVKVLRTVNRRFRPGRQEDSHEYLRCLLDALHEACLKPFKPKPPPHLAATTFINRIFGAQLRSRIKCHGVDYESSTYETFMDLSLEINRASTVQRALQHFTAKETLDGDNKYRCPKNNKLVRAEKQITIEEAPNVLTIHLKRFQFGGMGSKITKAVNYDKEMDLQPFMSRPECGPQWYDLYGVLVHLGHSVHSGHYYCFVRAGNGMWHKCDDTAVGQCSERTALGQQAYILFYVRRQPRFPAATPHPGPAHAGPQPAPKARPAAVAGAAAEIGVSCTQEPRTPNGTYAANRTTSRAAGAAAAATAAGHGINGIAANGAGKSARSHRAHVVVAENGAGAHSGRAADSSKRGHPDAPAAATSNGVGVDGGVLLPPSKKVRGGADKGERELRGSKVTEGLQPYAQPSSSAGHHSALVGLHGQQGEGAAGEASSPGSRASPQAHPVSSSRPATQSRGHLFRYAAQLSRRLQISGLANHISAHLKMQQGHRNQRHARELRARSRTEVKLWRGQQQQQPHEQEQEGQPQEPEQDGLQGQGQQGHQVQQNGRWGSHLHASTSDSAAPSSCQHPGSPPQRQQGVRSRQRQQQQQESAEEGATHLCIQNGGINGKAKQHGHRSGAHQLGQHQQQQQQQGGGCQEVLVGADAARLLGSSNGGAAAGRGKPAEMQPWPDVDPGVARQQEEALAASRQQKRSRQLDVWDQEYDAGKIKKVRNKDRAGADLHAGGNAFQAYQQQKHGKGIGDGSSGTRHGSKYRKGFGGGSRDHGRRGGRGGRGGRFSPRFSRH